jgi:hypothetical protein
MSQKLPNPINFDTTNVLQASFLFVSIVRISLSLSTLGGLCLAAAPSWLRLPDVTLDFPYPN